MAAARSVLLLATESQSTRIMYHALRNSLPSAVGVRVLVEDPVSRKLLLKRRVKRLGLLTVAGQVAFMATVVPLLGLTSRRRVRDIKMKYSLNDSPIPEPVHHVRSANSSEARALLRSMDPTVIVVNGTRILGAETLAALDVPFINMHAGITPAYRGVHGGYWALAEQRPDLMGTTVHRVDEGIDTGEIIEQGFFPVTARDNFSTYPYLHTAAGLPLLLRAVEAALEGSRLPTCAPAAEMKSVLRYHPTVWTYVLNRVRHGIR
jgi:folate-dependent phosphoribosylglycinamide formyltransferase PurN